MLYCLTTDDSVLAAFCATRSADLVNGSSVVDFDDTLFNEHDDFDVDTDTFTPPVSGLYWVHFNVGVPDIGEATDVRVSMPDRTINIMRGAADGDSERVSARTELTYLAAGK